MSDFSELEIERRNQIFRDKYMVPFVLRLRRFSRHVEMQRSSRYAEIQRFCRHNEMRKCHRNRIRAWKSQQRKLAKAQRPETLARRRRLYRGIKSMTKKHNPPMKAHGLRRSPQALRLAKEALRRKLRQANKPPPNQRDEALESQLPEAPTRGRRLCRGSKPRAEEQSLLIRTLKPLRSSQMLRREHIEATRRWKLQQFYRSDSIEEDYIQEDE
ncbi:uncharacterized protein EAE97_010455 [Botrytis byssoidea]|uniref:Uncharacterized protein n=1 Tax=Botrytis byssoidea TaxID=139641 RepID=A0A9P5LUW9_9HELO|nr:uncharacterized protein EAE97_010455 [Botrytis byssoidea]KAF7925374.1 hypothetical protein EAE97_010455 [Botrytis byssoidea]